MEQSPAKPPWQQRLRHELEEYLVNFVYMAVFFSAVILYRRMVLAQYDIHLHDYFMGVLKALVIAKVVMLGAFMRVSHKWEHKPLIFPVIYKAVLFTLLVMLFDVLEEGVRAAIGHPTLASVMQAWEQHIDLAWLASALLIFVAFLPFFGFREMARVMGSDALRNLFFRERSETP